jgi:hypothetical protein
MDDDDRQATEHHQWELEQQQQIEEADFSGAFSMSMINISYKGKSDGKTYKILSQEHKC